MQTTVLFITLIGMALIAASFIYVAQNASQSHDEPFQVITKKAYRIRRVWFISLCFFGIGLTVASLVPFPIHALSKPAQVITAVGGQWFWKLDSNTATVDKPVQFHVSSADVNHGFAIYNPDNRIVAQTQAMPGFINKLDVTFSAPGKYKILCLEYCGVAHHGMMAEIIVSEAD